MPRPSAPLPAVAARLLALALVGPLLAQGAAAQGEVRLPDETRQPVDLVRELAAPWQAGGEVAGVAGPPARPAAGRLAGSPAGGQEEQAPRGAPLALARKLNLVTQPRVVPFALPLDDARIGLLERFALSDAGAVWFRELADDTLRLLNQGYLEVDETRWQAFRVGGPRPRLSELITGQLSEAGQFAQDAAVFRFFGFDGFGAMAAFSSIRMGLSGFRCHFPVSGELVDPLAILSHEFGHTRYGEPRSAGLPLGEARTVARYENPVRQANGFPPRSIYYLRVDAARPAITRDPLFLRALNWRQEPGLKVGELDPVLGLLCECPGAPEALYNCLALPAAEAGRPEAVTCNLRWLAVRVDDLEGLAAQPAMP